MEISKTKILVYALTFIAYAWSGYGENIISNLRDAVLAAEEIFGHFVKNAIDLTRKLSEAHRVLDAAEDDCKFTCPSGGTPVKNKYHKPSYNGCGTDILQLKISEYVPAFDMTGCCNDHDICYDTCNNIKKDCDDRFKNCLYGICHKISTIDTLIKACKVAASMVSGSMTLGCKSYLESQRKSCYCPHDDKKKKFTPGGEL